MIAVLGAMRDEIAPLLARVRVDGADELDGRRVVRASYADRRLAIWWTGEGRRQALEGVGVTLDRLLRHEPIERVLIVGVAGGLSPEMAVGDLVVSEDVAYLRGSEHVSLRCRSGREAAAGLGVARDGGVAASSAHPLRLGLGRVATCDGIVAHPAHKAELWRSLGSPGVATVDMESYHVAAELERRAVPWLVLRAVSDPAEAALPAWLPGCVGADSAILRRRVLARLAIRPWSVGPLLRLRSDVRAAAERLAEGVTVLLERVG